MHFLDNLIGLIAPFNCLMCGMQGKVICTGCSLDAFPAVPSRCYRCRKHTSDSKVCLSCRRQGKIRNLWVVTDFEKYAQELVYKLKFERVQSAAEIIAKSLDETLPFIKPQVLVTIAPTSGARRRQRGYDQAELIARSFARRRGLRFAQTLVRASDFRQTGANRSTRLKQLSGAFWPIRSYLFKNTPVLIIDDVLTTGATLQEAARTLHSAGAETVNAAVFAQTL